MKVTLLGFTIPNDLLREINNTDARMVTQTHRFAWGIVNGLQSAGVEVDLLSAVPASDYPANPRILFRGGSFEQAHVKGRYLPFLNILAFKHVTRWLSVWIIGRRHLLSSKSDWLLVHGVHTPFLWFAALVGPKLGIRVAVILTDPPGVVLPNDSAVRRKLKDWDISLTKSALNRIDATIALTEPLVLDYAPGVRSLNMEGLFDSDAWDGIAPESDPSKTKVITYAGGVSEEYGVGMLVRAVLECSDPDIELRIFGRGPLAYWISKVAEVDPRVRPVSLVDPAKLNQIYAESSVLIQPRPIDQLFVKYSFPSKLIEYLASGIPVVTTRLPSIPSDYDAHVVWAEDTEEGLRTAIERVLTWPPEVRASFGTAASNFIRTTKSTTAQGRRIRQFLESGS